MAAAPAFVGTPKFGVAQLLNATGTAKVTLITAPAAGSKVTSINAASTDTVGRILDVWVTRAGTSYLLMATAVPATAGGDPNGLINSVNLLAGCLGLPVDNDGQKYLLMESADTLQVNVTVAVTAGKEIDVVAVAGNF